MVSARLAHSVGLFALLGSFLSTPGPSFVCAYTNGWKAPLFPTSALSKYRSILGYRRSQVLPSPSSFVQAKFLGISNIVHATACTKTTSKMALYHGLTGTSCGQAFSGLGSDSRSFLALGRLRPPLRKRSSSRMSAEAEAATVTAAKDTAVDGKSGAEGGALFPVATKLESLQHKTFLEDMSNQLFVDASDARGSFLGIDSAKASALFDLNLGQLHCERLLACSRQKLWWMNPTWGTKADEIPVETQFLLLKLQAASSEEEDEYAVILPLVSGSFRSCLTGRNNTNQLRLRAESGDASTTTKRLSNAVFVASGPDPFKLLEESFAAVAERLQTFRVRAGKPLPASLDAFGWCTWDAFYSDVDGDGIVRGLQTLRDGGVPARTLIIGMLLLYLIRCADDGWQDTGHEEDRRKQTGVRASVRRAVQDMTRHFSQWYGDRVLDGAAADSNRVALWQRLTNSVLKGPVLANQKRDSATSDFTKRLRSAEASPRFASSLRQGFPEFVARIKREYGLSEVYCWHALFGYWSGLQPAALDAQESPFSDENCAVSAPSPMGGILQVEPGLAWDPLTLNGVGMVRSEAAGSLYQVMHQYLASCGVDGVKVDAQSLATMMGEGRGGSAATARAFVQAMEASVREHFGSSAQCINCMCHATECLYAYQTTAVARASDDFWPRDPASQTVHIANVAYNSLFVGEILQPDWDMFQSSHESAALHAVARAVGGCAVYVSDRPGHHNLDILRRLVLSDGSVLRAKLPGRPTVDCLFADVLGDGRSALKVWNRNSCGGVLAAMNVQGAHWDKRARRNLLDNPAPPRVEASVGPRDIAGLVEGDARRWAVLTTRWGADGAAGGAETRVMGAEERVAVSLASKESAVFTMAVLRTARAEGGGAVAWAALGLEGMLNGGAAVVGERESVRLEWEGPEGAAPVDAEIEVTGEGRLLLYCEGEPRRVLVGGGERRFEFSAGERALQVEYTLDETREGPAVVQVQF